MRKLLAQEMKVARIGSKGMKEQLGPQRIDAANVSDSKEFYKICFICISEIDKGKMYAKNQKNTYGALASKPITVTRSKVTQSLKVFRKGKMLKELFNKTQVDEQDRLLHQRNRQA